MCYANSRSAMRCSHNVRHVALETYSATTLHEQDQLLAPYLLEKPHITLSEMAQDYWVVVLSH